MLINALKAQLLLKEVGKSFKNWRGGKLTFVVLTQKEKNAKDVINNHTIEHKRSSALRIKVPKVAEISKTNHKRLKRWK